MAAAPGDAKAYADRHLSAAKFCFVFQRFLCQSQLPAARALAVQLRATASPSAYAAASELWPCPLPPRLIRSALVLHGRRKARHHRSIAVQDVVRLIIGAFNFVVLKSVRRSGGLKPVRAARLSVR